MSDHRRLSRIARRAADLSLSPPGAPPPDPARAVAEVLEPLRAACAVAGVALCVLAALAPSWTGSPSAVWLAGLPAAVLLGASALASRPMRRRRAMIAATACAGFLALACAPALGALGQLGDERRWAVAYQLACLVVAAALLAVAWPCWRRAEEVRRRTTAERALYDEL